MLAEQPAHNGFVVGKVSSAAVLVADVPFVKPCLSLQIQNDQLFDLCIG